MFLLTLLLTFFSINLFSQNMDTLSGVLYQDITLYNDVIYVLEGRVTVPNGRTLTIQPGTIIKGAAGVGVGFGANASYLLIARGGTLNAVGTPLQPIIFTSTADSLDCNHPNYPGLANLTTSDNGLWGGLIILGNAPISAAASAVQVAGIPTTNSNGLYGGTDAADNSGTIAYVSIRHGGTNIGNGNEINGLTLGGVGAGTTIHHIEVVGQQDDGIEFFGGTVNVDDLLVWSPGDDGIDTDQAWAGTLDNFIIICDSATNHALEIDGPEGALLAGHTVRNGSIKGALYSELGDFRQRALGMFSNIYFFNFPDPSSSIGVGDFSLSYNSDLTFANGGLSFQNLQIDTTGMNAPMLTSIFKNGTDAHASIVSSATSTVGANICSFTNWTAAAKEGLLTSEFTNIAVGCNDPMASNYCPFASAAVDCRYDTLVGDCALSLDTRTIEELPSISVYPNPVENQFTIEIFTDQFLNINYNIYDVLGTKIAEGIISETVTILNSSKWTKGMYIVEIQKGKQRVIQKIIKG